VISEPGQYRLAVNCSIGPAVDAYGIVIAADDVHLNLQGHTISGPVATAAGCTYANYGIVADNRAWNVEMSNGTLRGFYFGLLLNQSGNGHDIQMTGLTLSGNCIGFNLRDTRKNNFSGNTVSGSFKVGVSAQRANDNIFSTNTVTNSGSCCGDGAVFFSTSSRNTFSGNIVSNNLNGLRILDTSQNNVISGNTLSNNHGNFGMGIMIDAAVDSGNLIQGNTALGNDTDLGAFNSACTNTWINNTFVTDTEGNGPGAGCIR
jgi:parallel beta-helix repeat protein